MRENRAMDYDDFVKGLSWLDKVELSKALESNLGEYVVGYITYDDVKDRLVEEGKTLPDDEAINNACHYVARKAGIDLEDLIDWACEVALEKD